MLPGYAGQISGLGMILFLHGPASPGPADRDLRRSLMLLSSCGPSEGLQVLWSAARSMRPSAAFAEGLGALSTGMALSGKMMMALRTGNETNLQSRRLRTQEQLPHMKRP